MKFRINLSTLLAIPLIIIQYILFSFNTANADMTNYIIRYNNVLKLGPRYFGNFIDIGFNYYMFFIHKLNLDYQTFLIISGTLAFFSLIYICKHYGADYFYFFVCFLFSFFFIEVVILRQFLSSVLIALAFIFVKEEKKWYQNLLCLVLLICAISIHISAFLSFLYFFSYKFKLRTLYYGALVGIISSYFMQSAILPVLTKILGAKFAIYTNVMDASIISFLAKVVFLVVSLVLFGLLYKYFCKNSKYYQEKHKKLSELALKSTLINSLFISLMLVDISFERLLIIPVFIYLATIAIFFRFKAPFTKERILLIILICIWIFLSYRIFVWSDMANTTIPILNENLLWGN
ncbi:EpsG family protein [Streptococcus suis]|nr:EpsG family protein [Streptococcus suis]